MKTVKNVIGTLEIDIEKKTLCVNSLNKCILKLDGLNFLNSREKFATISGTVSSGVSLDKHIPEDSVIEKATPRIVSLVNFLIFTIDNEKLSPKEVEKLLVEVQSKVKKIFTRN